MSEEVPKIEDFGVYVYGMKYRGFSPGCQPMEGYIDKLSEEVVKMTRYHDILLYDRELTGGECRDYELDLVTFAEIKGENA